MTLYRFEFDEVTRMESVCGIELRDNRAAMYQARLAVQDSLIDANIEGIDQTEWILRVYGDFETQIGSIRFADHIADLI
jgi:hypothetical protein